MQHTYDYRFAFHIHVLAYNVMSYSRKIFVFFNYFLISFLVSGIEDAFAAFLICP